MMLLGQRQARVHDHLFNCTLCREVAAHLENYLHACRGVEHTYPAERVFFRALVDNFQACFSFEHTYLSNVWTDDVLEGRRNCSALHESSNNAGLEGTVDCPLTARCGFRRPLGDRRALPDSLADCTYGVQSQAVHRSTVAYCHRCHLLETTPAVAHLSKA